MDNDAKMLPTVFAQRRLHLRFEHAVEDLLVQFGPVIRQDRASFCRYTVTGSDGNLTRDIWGADDVQAIELAMKMAGSDLDRLARDGTYSIAETSDSETGHGLPTFDFTAPSEH